VLVIAMLIAPPATAILLTDRFHRLVFLAAGIGVLAAVGGLYLSYFLDVASGATMVLVSALFFATALFFSPRRGLVPRAIRRRRAANEARIGDYLKALYSPSAETLVSQEALADRLRDTPAAALAATRHLGRLGLVESMAEGVRLTPEGRRRAAQVVRTHRLWERFLVDRAGMSWDEVHATADRIEHDSTPAVTDALARAVEGQATDPHGAPIPTQDGVVAPRAVEYLLSELQAGQSAVVTSVEDEDPQVLRDLSALGLMPGTTVRLLEATGDALRVALDDGERTVSRRIARSVFVVIPPPP
jgi:Mn-dependent DtxR family transcriptional regulator